MTDRIDVVYKTLHERGHGVPRNVCEDIIYFLDQHEQARKDELRKRPYECRVCGGVVDRLRNMSPLFHVDGTDEHVVVARDRKP